jgi:alpha-beta hydrolase superfamily lysophospholipase
MNSSTFTWQNANAQTVFARIWAPQGEPKGVVSLVHGLGEHTGRYQHVAEAMNAAGYAMLGFDLPGHGLTEGTRGHASYDDILNDIDCLLKETSQRYPGKPGFIYGHSLGGALVLYYCLKRQPVLKGAVVSAPGLAAGAPLSPVKLGLAKVMGRLAPSLTMENGLDVKNLAHDFAVVQAYQADPLVHSRISARLGLDLLSKGQWMLEHAAEFPLPLLLIQGSADHLVSPQVNEQFARAAPPEKTTWKVWDGLYHETHNEPEKQKVIQYIIDWLDGHL